MDLFFGAFCSDVALNIGIAFVKSHSGYSLLKKGLFLGLFPLKLQKQSNFKNKDASHRKGSLF